MSRSFLGYEMLELLEVRYVSFTTLRLISPVKMDYK